MKVAALILTMFLAAVSAAGQVTTNKNDIPESQYLAAEAKAAELLKTANYRSRWVKSYLEDNLMATFLQEMVTREVIRPNKWRTITVKLYENPPVREEIIADGKDFYFRTDNGPWTKGGLGSGSGGVIETGQVKNQFRYLPAINYGGKKVNLYEKISVRTANKLSQTDLVVVRYIRTTRIWYSLDGKILQKIEETRVEGSKEMLRETTTYEYDPKDLKIEAPVIK